MPNVNELRNFLKADMVRTGDLIHFCDAGAIGEKEFDQDGKKKTQMMLEMDVMVGETMKKIKYSPNVTTRELLKAAWGPDTENWVGETGTVNIVEQLSFGKLTPVLIVKPLTNLGKGAQIAALKERAQAAKIPPPPLLNPSDTSTLQGNTAVEPKEANGNSLW